jgi:bifunctional DNase/RNase
MDREIRMYSFEVGSHPVTNFRLIELKNKEGENILVAPIDIFSAVTYFRSTSDYEYCAPAHKMFTDVIASLGGKLQKVVIDDLKKGQFFASICYTDRDGDQFTERANAGDALAMAFRAPCCVYVMESIIDAAENDSINRVYWYDPTYEETLKKVKDFSRKRLAALPQHELKNLLQFASDTEDFEFAKRLKKVIDAKKSKTKD